MGAAYTIVALLYAASFVLTWRAGGAHKEAVAPTLQPSRRRASPWRELAQGLVYAWNTPLVLAMLCLAFLLNLTAFPLMNGLQPYVAKEIYHGNQTVLGYMIAATSFGALIGSLLLSRSRSSMPAARVVVVFSLAWYLAMFVFSRMASPTAGIMVLVFAGFVQSLSQVPMATLLLRNVEPDYRGRVMGIRMMMVNGNVPGLLISAPLIATYGYSITSALYCTVGIICVFLIVTRWREQLWERDSPANKP